MLSLKTILIFSVTVFPMYFIPAADNTLILMQSSLQGRKAGLMITLGVCLGIAIYAVAVVVGLAAIFQTSALAFNVLKCIGTAYLLFLAWEALKPVPQASEGTHLMSPSALFRRGLFICISNPITPVFMLVFFPTFIQAEPGADITFQLFQLGMLLVPITMIAYGLITITADAIGKKILQSEKAQRYLRYAASTVITIMAIFIAFSSPPV